MSSAPQDLSTRERKLLIEGLSALLKPTLPLPREKMEAKDIRELIARLNGAPVLLNHTKPFSKRLDGSPVSMQPFVWVVGTVKVQSRCELRAAFPANRWLAFADHDELLCLTEQQWTDRPLGLSLVEFLAQWDPDARRLFEFHSPPRYLARVDGAKAMAWLAAHRPDAHKALLSNARPETIQFPKKGSLAPFGGPACQRQSASKKNIDISIRNSVS